MSVKKQGICDRCNGSIKKPKGYLVWNPISDLMSAATTTPNQPVGTMLLCYKCARQIFSTKAIKFMRSKDVWKISKTDFNQSLSLHTTVLNMSINRASGSLASRVLNFQQDIDALNIFGIVQRLRKRGLDKKQAMKWARELGELWWSDPEKAEKTVSKKKFLSFWK